MIEFRPVGQHFPAGPYRLRNIVQQRSFDMVLNSANGRITIDVREPNGTVHNGVVRGSLDGQQNRAVLEHIQTDQIASRVSGLGALLVHMFAAHVAASATVIEIGTMAPTAAGFYQAAGFPVLATAARFFQQKILDAGANRELADAWRDRQRVFYRAFYNPQAVVGSVPGIPAPEATPAAIIATNAARMAHWRRV